MEINISADTTSRNRMETIFDGCQYRGCKNRRLSKGGVHLFRFPSRGDARLLTWIKHTGNKLILNWSLSALRKAGICGDHFSDESFQNSDRTKLKSIAVPEPYEEPELGECLDIIWDHNYAKQYVDKEIDAENAGENLVVNSETLEFERADKVRAESHPAISLPEGGAPWRSNPTFIRTYSRKLTFKDPDDLMEWTAIEPGFPEDNVRELRASEALKQSVAAIKTAAAEALVQEHENRENRELRIMNMELRRQNKMLRIENFKLQLRLATTSQCKTQRLNAT